MEGHALGWVIGLVGLLIVVAFLFKALLRRARLPPIVGFLALGLLVEAVDWQWGLIPAMTDEIVAFLGQLGVIALLFHVGLKSHFEGLRKQLGRASGVWIVNVALSGLAGWAGARYLLGLELVPSLFLTVALTATSVGVPLAVWEDEDAVDTEEGELFLDVAELDDVSSILLMAVLFTAAPILAGQGEGSLVEVLTRSTLWFIFKLALFAGGCVLFSLYLEAPLTRYLEEIEHGPDPMLSVVGIGVIIAALAGLLGLSIAVGAFFAGLTFSRDPKAVEIDASFESLYEFFVPFFFIHVGMMASYEGLDTALGIGAVLLVVAALGKFLGGAVPAWPLLGAPGAVAIGLSLIPRAEISMIVMQTGRDAGGWAVPGEVYSGMVLVTIVTCLVVPVLLRRQIAGVQSDADG